MDMTDLYQMARTYGLNEFAHRDDAIEYNGDWICCFTGQDSICFISKFCGHPFHIKEIASNGFVKRVAWNGRLYKPEDVSEEVSTLSEEEFQAYLIAAIRNKISIKLEETVDATNEMIEDLNTLNNR